MNLFPQNNILPVTDDIFKHEISKAGRKPVLVHFYEKDEDVALHLAAGHEYLADKVAYLSFKNPSEELKKSLEIGSLPKLVLISLSEGKENHSNMVLNEELVYFRVVNLTLQLLNIPYYREEGDFVDFDQEVEFFSSNKAFKDRCTKDSKLCIIGLIDKKEGSDDYLKYIKIIQGTIPQFATKAFIYGWIDARCHNEFAQAFEINEEHLPTVIFYSPKLSKFAPLFGSFEGNSIVNFVKRIQKGDVTLLPVDRKAIRIERKPCKGINYWNGKDEL